MIIAIASGKGGTGKTTIAASLALILAAKLRPAPLLLDCDVEAPNAHLFLRPQFQSRQDVEILIPQVDEAVCTHCGRCAEVCAYQAIAVLGKKTLVFPQLCHGCSSCTEQCPEDAIREVPYVIGQLEAGPTEAGISFGRGSLQIGEPMAVPVIRQLKSWLRPLPNQVVLVDCPPGASCPVVASIRDADRLLLVTEPTPFGLHDLKQAAGIARQLQIPAGVIVNRQVGDYPALEDFCRTVDLPILLSIPFDRQIAEGLARGQNLVDVCPEYIPRLQQVFEQVCQL